MPNLAGHPGRTPNSKHPSRRWALPLLGGAAMVVAGTALVRHLTPDRHSLRIATPLGIAHEQLARVLADHAAARGVTIEWIAATAGSAPLDLVQHGHADL